jgi:DNA-binding PadR family transcriptional regulator
MPTDVTSDPGVLILISLAAEPKHGHAMLLDIEAFAGRRLGPGTLYGALGRLEEGGFVEPLQPSGRRRPYRLTQEGRFELRKRLGRLAVAVRIGRERLGRGL